MSESQTPDLDCRLARVRGLVQGVGYRDACVAAARRCGLAGWVRNRRDGSVEALLLGDRSAIERMRVWLGHGPPASRVASVDMEDVPRPWPELGRFERRFTE